ncbi:unnamed protein product [Amaranthus hypochondriacus]
MKGTKNWVVAATIATVESLKDQGFARWNTPIRGLQQRATNNVRSYRTSLSTSNVISNKIRDSNNHKLQQSEDSIKNAMYFNCWGPS